MVLAVGSRAIRKLVSEVMVMTEPWHGERV
jgi:hypothetical protein